MPPTTRAREVRDCVNEVKQSLPQLLIDLLKEPFQYEPQVFARSSKTTDVFASKAQETRDALATMAPKLTHIIPSSNLVRQLLPELTQALEDIWVQPGDRLSIRVDSEYTRAPLTRAIHSEKDSEDLFLGLYLCPALSLLGFLNAKEKLKRADPSKKYTNDEIMDYTELKRELRFYAASCGGASNIADLGVYKLLFNGGPPDLHLAIEVKTPVAFPEVLLQNVSPRILSPAAEQDDDILETDMKKIEGWAIEFNWPKLNDNFGNKDSMKHNKVISQVWNQMVEHQQKFAILTCNDIHYCCYRKDLDSGYLYISPPLFPDEDGLANIVAWTLKAVGYLEGIIKVPKVFDKWWKEAGKSGDPGVNMKTLLREALYHYNKSKSESSR